MTDFVRKNIFKDLDLDFSPHPVTADLRRKTDTEAVKRAVRNLVLMSRYDKPFKPEIDARIQRLLFEPATPLVAMAIRSNIMDILNRYEPRARINDVQVIFDAEYNSFDVTVSFTVLNSREVSKVFVSIERLR
jgi:phage baseplate assembly protein W